MLTTSNNGSGDGGPFSLSKLHAEYPDVNIRCVQELLHTTTSKRIHFDHTAFLLMPLPS
jgi:hypothetical protein